jgi:hypothetical protein
MAGGFPLVKDPLPDGIDHLVFGCPALEEGVEQVEDLLGVRAGPGGRHPRWGTRNALLALGPRLYLEIVGPDADGPAPVDRAPGPPDSGQSDDEARREGRPTVFELDRLRGPGLVRWALRVPDAAAAAARATRRGLQLGSIMEGSRTRPDGAELRWRLTDPEVNPADGIVPFLIDWGATEHPAISAPPAGELVALSVHHPDPPRIRRLLAALDLSLPVGEGARPGMTARIRRLDGRIVELSGAPRSPPPPTSSA